MAPAASRQLLLLNSLGEPQRTVNDVDSFFCHDLLGCGYPQILARRAAFRLDGDNTPRGYTLIGLSATFADVAAEASAPPPPPTIAAQKAHDGAVARRKQLLGVASALKERLSSGDAAVVRASREAFERGLLTGHVERLLLAEADDISSKSSATFEGVRHPLRQRWTIRSCFNGGLPSSSSRCRYGKRRRRVRRRRRPPRQRRHRR